MQNSTRKNSTLPFSCPMLCVSLVGATVLLMVIFTLYYAAYISMEVAIWASVGVFVVAAFYELFLLSLVARFMLKSVHENPEGIAADLNGSASSNPIAARPELRVMFLGHLHKRFV